MKNTWYVSYETGLSTAGGHYRRQTKSFSNEEEAKAFARTLMERDLLKMTSGTINPVRPKRLFATAEDVMEWLGMP